MIENGLMLLQKDCETTFFLDIPENIIYKSWCKWGRIYKHKIWLEFSVYYLYGETKCKNVRGFPGMKLIHCYKKSNQINVSLGCPRA